MNDYTWPSVYFAYFFFTISLLLGLFFFARSFRAGYWKKSSEDIKYCVFDEESAPSPSRLGNNAEPEQSGSGQEQ